jgi:hypothetical protein
MKHFLTASIVSVLALGANAQVGIGTVSPLSTLDVRGSMSTATRSFPGSTTAGSSDYTLIFDGAAASTVTLPDATTCVGRVYCIKNFSTTSPAPLLTIATTSSQKIDGLSSWTLSETNEVTTLVSDGSNWEIAGETTPSSTGSNWEEGGNSVTAIQKFGTITTYDLPFITNNTERMRITSAGSVGVGTSTFSASPEALLVYQNNATSSNCIGGEGNINNYLQLNIQNQNSGAGASSDVVATADNGTESSNYVDLGMNSSGYSATGITGGADNAYLLSSANDFVIGNTIAGHNLIFFTGGTATTNEHMRITTNGNIGINNTSPVAFLDVDSTVKVGRGGSVLNDVIRFTNQSITDNTPFSYTATRTETFTLSGVNQYATVIVTPRNNLPGTLAIGYAYASAANTVKVVLVDSYGPDAPGTISFDFTIIQ